MGSPTTLGNPLQSAVPMGGGLQDCVVQLRGVIQQLSAIADAFSGRTLTGSFTAAAAATTVIPQSGVQANSVIQLSPSNAAAGQTQGGTKHMYVSVKTPGVSFTVATADGTNPVAGSTFDYSMTTPL